MIFLFLLTWQFTYFPAYLLELTLVYLGAEPFTWLTWSITFLSLFFFSFFFLNCLPNQPGDPTHFLLQDS